MTKLKVGDYVRTKEYIRKIRKIEQEYLYCDIGVFVENEILKSSPNIGKLLKVGDFIDNHCITEIKGTTIYTNDGWFIDIEDIEDLVFSIVTKEQFEREMYRVNEKDN